MSRRAGPSTVTGTGTGGHEWGDRCRRVLMLSMLPVLGVDNERVFRDVLGLSEGEFDALRAQGSMD